MHVFNTESLQIAMKSFRDEFLDLMDQSFKLLYNATYNNTVTARPSIH